MPLFERLRLMPLRLEQFHSTVDVRQARAKATIEPDSNTKTLGARSFLRPRYNRANTCSERAHAGRFADTPNST